MFELFLDVPAQWRSGPKQQAVFRHSFAAFARLLADTDAPFELRLNFSPGFLAPRHQEETLRLIETLSEALPQTAVASSFFTLEPDTVEPDQLAVLERYGSYSAVLLAPADLDGTAPSARQERLERIIGLGRSGRIRMPAARVVLYPGLAVDQLYQSVFRRFGFRSLDIRLPADAGDPSAIGETLIGLLKMWIEDDDPNLTITFFWHIILAMKIGAALCSGLPSDPTDPMALDIEADGSIRPHARHAADPAAPNWSLTDFDPVALQDHIDLLSEVPANCVSCCWQRICKSGEARHRYRPGQGYFHESAFCGALDDLYSETALWLRRSGLPLSVIDRNIAAPLAADAMADATPS